MIEVKQSKTQFLPVRLLTINGDPAVGVPYTDVTASVVLSSNTVITLGVSSSHWVETTQGAFSGLGFYQLQIPETALGITGSFSYAVVGSLTTVPYIGSMRIVLYDEKDLYDNVVNITVSTGSLSLTALSASLRDEILTTRSILSGTSINVSASLRNEILQTRDVVSGSIVNLSSSLRGEILQTRDVLSGSVVTLSSSLRGEVLQNRDILSGSIVNVSASLRAEILTNRTTITSTSSSLGTGIDRLRKVQEGRWKIFPATNKMLFYDPADDTTVILQFDLSGSDGVGTVTNPFERNRVT